MTLLYSSIVTATAGTTTTSAITMDSTPTPSVQTTSDAENSTETLNSE